MTQSLPERIEGLTACPFCGAKPDLWPKRLSFKHRKAWITCPTPNCAVFFGEYRTREEAVHAWNERTGK